MSKLLIPIAAALIAIPAVAAIVALSSILNGWVLTKLWAWFIVPLFGAPTLTIAPAIGLALVAHCITYQHINAAKDKDVKWYGSLVQIFTRPLIVLGIGAIVHCFV